MTNLDAGEDPSNGPEGQQETGDGTQLTGVTVSEVGQYLDQG